MKAAATRLVALAQLVALALPTTAQAGDPARGETVFQRCYACHSVDPAETGLPGPNLHGVVGRPAGAAPEFEYSPAFQALVRQGHVWTPAALDAFLADPLAVAPDNAMAFFGLPSPRDRADLIAYLQRATAR